MARLYLDLQTALVNLATGLINGPAWRRFFQDLVTKVNAHDAELDGTIGVNIKTVAQLNALGLAAGDEGYIARVEVYDHLVRWTGSAWEWLTGDKPKQFAFWAESPGDGWAVCDGSATTVLAVGATLTEPSFTTPNVSGTATFPKTAASYTGTPDAAVAPGIAGSTATEAAHTHGVSIQSSTEQNFTNVNVDANLDGTQESVLSHVPFTGETHDHAVSGNTGAGAAHSHGVGTLAVDATAVPRSIGLLFYVRR